MSLLLEHDGSFFENFVFDEKKRKTYHEEINNNDTLLVTIGDSWTWGDSICNIGFKPDQVIDNPECRLSNVYGYHLKNLLDSDWINIAYPGTANRWIVDCALRFGHLSEILPYKKIILSIGLTDIGRDVIGIDISGSPLTKIKEVEQRYLTKIKQLEESNEKIVAIVGRNFTSTIDNNNNIVAHHLSDRWIDVSYNNWNGGWKAPDGFTVMPLNNLDNNGKQWFLNEVVPVAHKIIDYLNECPLHYKVASKHPTEKLHKLWADYVYQYITENKL
jgi:hypothetical protein